MIEEDSGRERGVGKKEKKDAECVCVSYSLKLFHFRIFILYSKRIFTLRGFYLKLTLIFRHIVFMRLSVIAEDFLHFLVQFWSKKRIQFLQKLQKNWKRNGVIFNIAAPRTEKKAKGENVLNGICRNNNSDNKFVRSIYLAHRRCNKKMFSEKCSTHCITWLPIFDMSALNGASNWKICQ